MRFLSVGQYLIAYAPEPDRIRIIAVFDGRGSRRAMAAVLRSRE